MAPYNRQAPEEPPETPEAPSPVASITEDPISSDSPTVSDLDVSYATSSDSECGDSYTLSAPGYEKIKIPIEQNLKQLLIKATNTTNLSAVTTIRLRIIARDFSLQRLPAFLPDLRELNLDGSCLMSLRDLGCDLHNLRVLRVARCGLRSLDGLFGLQTLVELHAGQNSIDDLSPCAVLPALETLDLRNNPIQDITSVTFLSLCTTLKHITLEECPTSYILNYRDTIKNILPDVLTLDGVPLRDGARNKDEGSTSRDSRIVSRFPPILKTESLTDKGTSKLTIKRPHTTDGIIRPTSAVKLLPLRPMTAREPRSHDFSQIVDASDLKLKDIKKLLMPSSGKLTAERTLTDGTQRTSLQAWNETT